MCLMLLSLWSEDTTRPILSQAVSWGKTHFNAISSLTRYQRLVVEAIVLSVVTVGLLHIERCYMLSQFSRILLSRYSRVGSVLSLTSSKVNLIFAATQGSTINKETLEVNFEKGDPFTGSLVPYTCRTTSDPFGVCRSTYIQARCIACFPSRDF